MASVTLTRADQVYEYEPYMLNQGTRPEHMEFERLLQIAAAILADEIYCAQLHHSVKTKLESKDRDTLIEALDSVHRLEFKIKRAYGGSWHAFTEAMRAEEQQRQEDKERRRLQAEEERQMAEEHRRQQAEQDAVHAAHEAAVADGDSLAIDQELASRQRHPSPSSQSADSLLSQVMDEQQLADLVSRARKLLAMDMDWSRRIRNGLKSRKLKELQAIVHEAESIIEKEDSPLTYWRRLAEELAPLLVEHWTPLPMIERKPFVVLYGKLTLDNNWDDPARLKGLVEQIQTILEPPTPEPKSFLPPPMTGKNIDWAANAAKGELGTRVQTKDVVVPVRGQVAGNGNRKKKGQRGGGIKTHPTRNGGAKSTK